MSETALTVAQPRAENFALGRLMPQSVKELHWFAQQASESGLFLTSAGRNLTRPLTPLECMMMMATGVEFGITPLQGLRYLSLIKGKIDVPPSVLSAKIASDPRVEMFDPDGDDTTFTIRAKRKDRINDIEITVAWSDLSLVDQDKHKEHREDFLYARCVRRITKRYFQDLVFGLAPGVEIHGDYRDTIDVPAIERAAGEGATGVCLECADTTYFVPNPRGGGFMRCGSCGITAKPTDAIRDAIRGGNPEVVVVEQPAIGVPLMLETVDGEMVEVVLVDPEEELAAEARQAAKHPLQVVHEDKLDAAAESIEFASRLRQGTIDGIMDRLKSMEKEHRLEWLMGTNFDDWFNGPAQGLPEPERTLTAWVRSLSDSALFLYGSELNIEPASPLGDKPDAQN